MIFFDDFFDKNRGFFWEFLKILNSTNFTKILEKFTKFWFSKNWKKTPITIFSFSNCNCIDFLNYICHFEIPTQYYDCKTLDEFF